jgi:branched-chain amino acid transport system permease protein
MIFLDIGLNAIASGIILGCIYALLSLGLAVTFGVLHIPNVAHPALVIAGAYVVTLFTGYGIDPILGGLLAAIVFYFLGVAFYEFYARAFESRGRGQTIQSLTLFFGVSLLVEIILVIAYGADLRSVDVGYVGKSLNIGFLQLPFRLLIPALVSLPIIGLLWLYLTRTHTGLAIRAVAHDERAVSIAGINPAVIKRHSFGIATALAAFAGSALIIIAPVDPFAGRLYLGRVFAVVVLAGMGAIPGTLVAAIMIGVAEALVTAFIAPSWAPGVAFVILLVTLALRPNGLFGTAS